MREEVVIILDILPACITKNNFIQRTKIDGIAVNFGIVWRVRPKEFPQEKQWWTTGMGIFYSTRMKGKERKGRIYSLLIMYNGCYIY